MATTDEVFLAEEIKLDIVRMLPNVLDEIANIRARIVNGENPSGAALTASAKQLLGRLKNMYDAYQEDQTKFVNALGVLGVTQTHFANRVTSYRDACRAFRDASKSNNAEITTALNAFEAALPAQKRFLNKPLPSDW